MKNRKKLPTLDEILNIATYYTDVQCCLQNFEDEDTIIIERMRFVDGYIKAIKDYIDPNYNP